MDVHSELNLYQHVNFLAETSKQNQSKNNKDENIQNKTALNVRPKRKKKSKSKQKQKWKPPQQQQKLQLLNQKPKPYQQQRQNQQKNSGAKKNFNKFQSKVSSPFFCHSQIVLHSIYWFILSNFHSHTKDKIHKIHWRIGVSLNSNSMPMSCYFSHQIMIQGPTPQMQNIALIWWARLITWHACVECRRKSNEICAHDKMCDI